MQSLWARPPFPFYLPVRLSSALFLVFNLILAQLAVIVNGGHLKSASGCNYPIHLVVMQLATVAITDCSSLTTDCLCLTAMTQRKETEHTDSAWSFWWLAYFVNDNFSFYVDQVYPFVGLCVLNVLRTTCPFLYFLLCVLRSTLNLCKLCLPTISNFRPLFTAWPLDVLLHDASIILRS